MITKIFMQLLLVMSMTLGFNSIANAQADMIEGFWYNDIKDAKIQIYRGNDNKYYGKIVWLKEPMENGKPKLDKKNPKEKFQSRPIVGLIILKGFEKDDDIYDDGTIYDPLNGKTYDCTITPKNQKLSIRGYIGISLFGRTTVWEKAQ